MRSQRKEGHKPKANPNGSGDSPNKKKIIDAVVQHKMTPKEKREHKTLRQLAKSLGVSPNTYFYNLADSTDVYHQLLIHGTGESIAGVPQVLAVLKERALAGSNPAAEIYLNHIRHTITDDKFMRHLKPVIDPNAFLNDTLSSATDLLKLAHALGSNEEEARKRMDALKDDMVEGEFEEVPNGE